MPKIASCPLTPWPALNFSPLLHAHMLIEVKHYTKIHLNVNKLRAYMETAMGNHIHINNKLPGSGKEDLDCIKAYITKEKPV